MLAFDAQKNLMKPQTQTKWAGAIVRGKTNKTVLKYVHWGGIGLLRGWGNFSTVFAIFRFLGWKGEFPSLPFGDKNASYFSDNLTFRCNG